MDPITLGVIWGALQSIAVEIGTTVHKTAYSEQAREGQDFSVAVFDRQGRMVAQGPYSPGHMGAMSFAVKNALAAHPVETLRPGDAILLNDPLLGSGHLPDFFVTQPAFHEGELVGFAVNILHHTDVGGQRPGSQGVEGIFDYLGRPPRPTDQGLARVPGGRGHRRDHRREHAHARQGPRRLACPAERAAGR